MLWSFRRSLVASELPIPDAGGSGTALLAHSMTSQAGSTASQVALRTLVLTDLVGSTRLVEQLGDARVAEVFSEHDRCARDLLVQHHGIEIDKTDGFLLLFERPVDGVLYALDYHRALVDLSRHLEVVLTARVGAHLGEVILRENSPQDVARGAKPVEVEGLAKPIAARLMSLATAGQTLMTRAVFDFAERAMVDIDLGDREITWLVHGLYRFAGVEKATEIFEAGEVGIAPLAAPPDSIKAARLAGTTKAVRLVLGTEYNLGPSFESGRRRFLRRRVAPVVGVLVGMLLIVALIWGFGGSQETTARDDRDTDTPSLGRVEEGDGVEDGGLRGGLGGSENLTGAEKASAEADPPAQVPPPAEPVRDLTADSKVSEEASKNFWQRSMARVKRTVRGSGATSEPILTTDSRLALITEGLEDVERVEEPLRRRFRRLVRYPTMADARKAAGDQDAGPEGALVISIAQATVSGKSGGGSGCRVQLRAKMLRLPDKASLLSRSVEAEGAQCKATATAAAKKLTDGLVRELATLAGT